MEYNPQPSVSMVFQKKKKVSIYPCESHITTVYHLPRLLPVRGYGFAYLSGARKKKKEIVRTNYDTS